MPYGATWPSSSRFSRISIRSWRAYRSRTTVGTSGCGSPSRSSSAGTGYEKGVPRRPTAKWADPMSGHSKWHNIRLRKGKVDAQRGALFTKLSREIILAAKSGSPDPEANYRLKMAVEKARAANMPQDNIKRAIARACGEGEREIEEIRYEGYGPAGVAVIVDAATDNRNRTASELRFLFSRNDGNLGETGSVGWMFASRGVVEVDPGRLNDAATTEKALVDGVIDVRFSPAGDDEEAR